MGWETGLVESLPNVLRGSSGVRGGPREGHEVVHVLRVGEGDEAGGWPPIDEPSGVVDALHPLGDVLVQGLADP